MQILEKRLEKKAKIAKVRIEELPAEVIQAELDYVDQLLINYGYTMDKQLAYIEKVSGIMFMRYYLGNMKAMWSMTKKHSSRTLTGLSAQGATGVNLNDPFDALNSTPVAAVANRFFLNEAPGEVLMPNLGKLMPSFEDILR